MPNGIVVSPGQLAEYRARRGIPARMPTPLSSTRHRTPALYEFYSRKFAAYSRRAGLLFELGAINMEQDLTIHLQRDIMHQIEIGDITPRDQDTMDITIVHTLDRLVGRPHREAYLSASVHPRTEQQGYARHPPPGDNPIYRGVARLALRDYVGHRAKAAPSGSPLELPRDFPWPYWVEICDKLRRLPRRPAYEFDFEIAIELLASAKAWPTFSKVMGAYSAASGGRALAQAAAARVLDDLTFGSGSAPQLASSGRRPLPSLPRM